MILRIRHKGLRSFWHTGNSSGINQNWVETIDQILFLLNNATLPEDIDIPGLRLHGLKGTLKGFYSVKVSRNWRIIFRFEDGNVTDVDLIDYH